MKLRAEEVLAMTAGDEKRRTSDYSLTSERGTLVIKETVKFFFFFYFSNLFKLIIVKVN